MSQSFNIRQISSQNAKEVIENIGFDKSYLAHALLKYNFVLFRIENLSCAQANILKQTALSAGADTALNREAVTGKIEKTDALLGATKAQIIQIAQRLKNQPFKLAQLGELLLEKVSESKQNLIKIGAKEFDLNAKTYVMGILNVTPDSFSDGGKHFSFDLAVKAALKMIEDGADIIDIGGESTRPFSAAVTPEEQIKRIIPIIKEIRKLNSTIPLSVDTRSSKVAEEAVKSGADMINDVSGFEFDNQMLKVVSDSSVPCIICHSKGTPENMQINPIYENCIVDEIYNYLSQKTALAQEHGIKNIILDPGIGFGKTLEHNLQIIKRIAEFKSIGYPLLVGLSRKTFIQKILDLKPDETDNATIALNSYLYLQGVNFIRVHDVKAHAQAVKVLEKI